MQVARSLSSMALEALAFRNCSLAEHPQGVCPLVLTADLHPHLWVLATVWSLALPSGPVAVLSGYERARELTQARDGTHDAARWVGPPRTPTGSVARVNCSAVAGVD